MTPIRPNNPSGKVKNFICTLANKIEIATPDKYKHSTRHHTIFQTIFPPPIPNPMSSHALRLNELIGPTNPTEWSDEQHDQPPVQDQDRAALQSWLDSCTAPVATDAAAWSAVVKNWIRFLTATSRRPNAEMAPNQKKIQWLSQIPETDTDRAQRFRQDRRQRRSVQHAVWRLFDNLDALTERWPPQSRLMLNQITDGPTAEPLCTLMDQFRRQRRWNAVWTSFVCFLLHAFDEKDALREMGLDLSEDVADDLMDIQQALLDEGYPLNTETSLELVENALLAFFTRMLTDTHPTAQSNPLLWWVAVLVRSALSHAQEPHRDDYISSGQFNANLMPMDLNVRGRLEALLHHSKIILLDRAFNLWQPRASWRLQVEQDLNTVNNTWIGKFGGERPDPDLDRRRCDSPAWRDALAHIEKECQRYLNGQHPTAMREVRRLAGK